MWQNIDVSEDLVASSFTLPHPWGRHNSDENDFNFVAVKTSNSQLCLYIYQRLSFTWGISLIQRTVGNLKRSTLESCRHF